jgi:hypothetical protein
MDDIHIPSTILFFYKFDKKNEWKINKARTHPTYTHYSSTVINRLP